MKSSFIKINKFIPLLTDTLPYEVPVLFSNRGLYETIKEAYNTYYDDIVRQKARGKKYEEPKTIEEFLKDEFITDKKLLPLLEKIKSLFDKPLLPYEYMIAKNQGIQRKISLVHPISQIKICDFYAKHAYEILFHVTQSAVSLRHPIKITSRILRQHASLMNKITKEAELANCDDPREVLEYKNKFGLDDVPNNYFVYKKYRLMHEFYNSSEFLDLEKRFNFCFKFDIKRCFDSIYTHSIAWAIKGKQYAKKHKGGFEKEIDTLMQHSNWAETHGIPIGAEFSRIFAEIILQKIDQNVEIAVEYKTFKVNGSNIKRRLDFEVRRYLDDFFVFVNNKEIGDAIVKEYERQLLEYKLFPNQDKYAIMQRPFITKNTVAKQKILSELKKAIRTFHYTEKQFVRLNSDNLFTNAMNCHGVIKNLIETIRATIYDADVEMMDISNLMLSEIKKELIKILSIIISIKESKPENIETLIGAAKIYLNDILELVFYIFHLSPRANTTYGICKICFEIIEIIKRLDDDRLNDEIRQKIYSQFLLFFEKKQTNNCSIIEFLDIIWIINELGEKYLISEARLIDFLNLEQRNIGYFEMMVVLSYIKNMVGYDAIRKIILEAIKDKMTNSNDIFEKAETFMMFFDIIKCPYVSNKYKKCILNISGLTKNHDAIIDFIKTRKWFFGWDEELNLKKLFEIKELQNAY